MCGILGFNFTSASLTQAISHIKSRGPDNTGQSFYENNTFAHTRLAIIDLDKEANQPMHFDDLILVFNGEIYNYKDLIIEENLKCITSSDSEVIIRLYQKYGIDFLNKLNGMFSFCLFDKSTNKYFCARDRYGKKPFFYYLKDGQFIFSSSIKSILAILPKKPKLNKVALAQYLQYFVPLGENTFYQDIKKLEASSYLIYENKKCFIKKYYKINTYKRYKDEKEALIGIENELISAVERRLVGDVEVGSLLSGGIDSSLISSLYTKISGKKIHTFSVGYKEYKNYDELEYAKTASLHIGSQHHPLEIGQKDFIDSLEEVFDALEEPHADAAAIPLYHLTKKINKMGIKTVLSGEGSDELFLGYDNYAKFLKYYEFQESLKTPQNDFLNSIISALQNNTKESEYLRRIVKKETLYNSFGEIYTDIQIKRLFVKRPTYKKEKPKSDPVDWMSYADLKVWLGQALLSKVDKISMANSLEVRTPFLDVNLVNYVFAIDSKLKVGNTNKYLLKKIASKYIPDEIITRSKKGFNSPFNEWIFAEYGNSIFDLIKEVNDESSLFNESYLEHIFILAKNKKFKQHLWAIYVFSKWYKKEYM